MRKHSKITVKKTFSKLNLPLYGESVSAGFPSPAEDYIQEEIDLNEYLVTKPASTFVLRVKGVSMINAGIKNDDLLIVDRSIDPLPGHIIVASLEGRFTLKRLVEINRKYYLKADNPNYPIIDISDYEYVQIWGVALYSIHKITRRNR